MNDQLDKLTDTELSECFAVEMAAIWRRETPRDGGVRAYSVIQTGAWREIRDSDYRPEDLADFATSADAVLPWLEKAKGDGLWVEIKDHTNGLECGVRDWLVILTNYNPSDEDDPSHPLLYIEGVSPTFPRAAAIALIRAKRATKS